MNPDFPDTDVMFDAALSAHEARRQDEARRLCENVLRSDPRHADALNLLAVILQDQGQVEESIALLTRAIDADSEFPDAFANLARGFILKGDAGSAANAARKATELDPDLGEGWQQLGFALVALERNEEGMAALREAVARIPDSAVLRTCVGRTALILHDHPTALGAWRQVLTLQPTNLEALVNLGIILTTVNELDEAVTVLRQAVDLAPTDIGALEAFARVLHRRFEAVELIAVCQRILAVQPERLDILALLSNGQIWLGQFKEIEKTRAAVLAVEPGNRSFAQQISMMVPDFIEGDDVAVCREQMGNTSLPVSDRINAGYALAKALDRAGDYDAAFDAYRVANALIHSEDTAANRGFDLAKLQSFVANMRTRYTQAVFAAMQPFGNPSDLPVFIVGMPRSGTSLVEQIAASHPNVFGAGERKEIVEIVSRLNGDRGFVFPTQWDTAQLQQEADVYLARLTELGGGADRVIDKLPDNIQLLGQIRVLFPNARIIICRRDLRDVCVSCFTTRFGDPIAWSNNLEECAERAVEIERLTKHWRLALPGPVMEISYERLVANLEDESRRLIDFLGLEWVPACLEFHRTNRPVSTSSAWQVRQPLYDSSVGRWKHYRAHLGPMLEVLKGYIPHETEAGAAVT